MAGVVDILLKIVGDSRDAVRSVDEVGRSAETAERKVTGLQSRFAGLVDTIRQTAIAGGVITGIAGQVNDVLDQVTAGRRARAEAGVGEATSRAELEAAFSAQINEALLSRSGSPLERLLGRRLSLPGGLFGTGDDPRVRDEVIAQQIGILVRGDPDRARAIADLGGPFSAQIRRELERGVASRRFQEELAGTTVNVYAPVGDRSAIGREVRAVLDARDRNNGRYVTTYTRR